VGRPIETVRRTSRGASTGRGFASYQAEAFGLRLFLESGQVGTAVGDSSGLDFDLSKRETGLELIADETVLGRFP
jgi:hypothetical protein